jgi:thymidylate kinase
VKTYRKCKPLIILEGVDGAGKTTLAQSLVEQFDAAYYHFDPLPHVKASLARIYIEAMLPALLGYQAVVLDRSWLSEYPYGMVFRSGQLRLVAEDTRMLERISLRCAARVVLCQPPVNDLKKNFERNKEEEYLKNVDQLLRVMNHYMEQETALPTHTYNYRTTTAEQVGAKLKNDFMFSSTHFGKFATAGTADKPKYIFIGQDFAKIKEYDSFHQFPFVSFSNVGCSRWFTRFLMEHNISENECFWANSDQLPPGKLLANLIKDGAKIITFGKVADQTIIAAGLSHKPFPHQQVIKRFGWDEGVYADFLSTIGRPKLIEVDQDGAAKEISNET